MLRESTKELHLLLLGNLAFFSSVDACRRVGAASFCSLVPLPALPAFHSRPASGCEFDTRLFFSFLTSFLASSTSANGQAPSFRLVSTFWLAETFVPIFTHGDGSS